MIRGALGWWSTETRAVRWALVAICAAAAVARGAALNQPMRYDESVTYLYFVGQSWGTALTAYQFPNNHLLYTILAKLTLAVTGAAPWAVRLPAFVAGLAIVPLTFAVGRRLFSTTAGLVGAALTAGATPLVLYSTNARGYSLVVAAFLLLLLIVDRLRSANGARYWVAFVAVSAIGVVTIPVMLYPLGAAALWLALTAASAPREESRRIIVRLLLSLGAAAALVMLAYLPIIHANGFGALAANKFVRPSTWTHFLAELPITVWITANQWAEPYPPIVAIALFIVAVTAVVRLLRSAGDGGRVFMAAFGWSTVVLLLTHRAPFPRTWLWILPLVALAAGTVVDAWLQHPRAARLGARAPLLASTVCVAVVAWGLATDAVAHSSDTGPVPSARALARAIEVQTRNGDRVVAPGPINAPLQYYLLRDGADTSILSTPRERAMRELILLDSTYGQTIGWAVHVGIVDTARFELVSRAQWMGDTQLIVAERKETDR